MATIIVHDLDDEVAERLRLHAQLHGVSVEEEVRRILTEGTRPTRAEIAARAAEIRARQPLHKSRSVRLISEDRNR